jgi:hypothetical protein
VEHITSVYDFTFENPVSLQHIIVKDRNYDIGDKPAYFVINMEVSRQHVSSEHFQPYTAYHYKKKPPQLLSQ